MVPVAAQDPGAGWHGGCEIPDAPDEFGGGACIAQLHRCQLHAATQEMHMGINESRRDELSSGIYDGGLAALPAFNILQAADGGNGI